MTWKQKKKIRRLLAMACAVIVTILAALACCGASEKEKEPEFELIVNEPTVKYSGIEVYTVQGGEGWSHIAVKYILSDEYMQQWIRDVKYLNNRKSDTVYFGETVKVYTYETEE